MKNAPLRLALTLMMAMSHRIYRGLVCLYPPAFRRRFGRRMARMFREYSQEVLQEQGVRGLPSLWLQTMVDLVVNLVLEWGAILRQPLSSVWSCWPILLIPLLGTVLGEIALRADTLRGLGLILLCAGLLGYFHSKEAWRWAPLLWAGVPYGRVVDAITGSVLPCHDYLSVTFLAAMTVITGVFSGVALGFLIRNGLHWRIHLLWERSFSFPGNV